MARETLSRRLASFVYSLSYEDLPGEVAEMAKTRILDSLSAAFAGHDLPWCRVALEFVKRNKGEATVIAHSEKVPAMDAALVNGVMAHSILQEDQGPGSHPSTFVVPTVLAAAEQEKASGKETLAALVVGYELGGRVALGLGEELHTALREGFRLAPVLGPFSCAAAAGKLLKLSEEQLANALGYAANLACGLSECWWAGTMESMFHVALTARHGILAAELARVGATCADTALEGRHGFYRAFSSVGGGDLKPVTDDLGKRFLIMDTLLKPFPAAGLNQRTIYLGLRIRELGINPRQIEKAIVKTALWVKINAGADLRGPFASQFQAQMSTQFCLAAAILGKSVSSPRYYQQHFGDPEVAELAQRIELVGEAERKVPTIEIDMQNGRHYIVEAEATRSLQGDVATMEAVKDKFTRYASDFLGQARISEIIDLVMRIEDLDNIDKLTAKLAA